MAGFSPNRMMYQFQKFQENMEKIQEELRTQEVEVKTPGNELTIRANGQQKITYVKLNPLVLCPENQTMLENLMVQAANEVLNKSKEMIAEQLSSLTGGMDLSSIMKMFEG